MILFCDTSALFKLYVVEPSTDRMLAAAAAADRVAVSLLAWVEFHAALAAARGQQRGAASAYDAVAARFSDDWPSLMVVAATEPVVRQAAELAQAFGLRAYDSVQLASVQQVARREPDRVRFACFDRRLDRAAHVLGIEAALA